MKLIIFFQLIIRISGLSHVQYKLLSLNDFQWSGYISKTISNNIKTNIECGALCSAQGGDGCHLYAPELETKTCHIGTFQTNAVGGSADYYDYPKDRKKRQSSADYYYDDPIEEPLEPIPAGTEPIGTQPVYISLSKMFKG